MPTSRANFFGAPEDWPASVLGREGFSTAFACTERITNEHQNSNRPAPKSATWRVIFPMGSSVPLRLLFVDAFVFQGYVAFETRPCSLATNNPGRTARSLTHIDGPIGVIASKQNHV